MRLTDLRGIHSGQRCFLFGSGPSLAYMDLTPLKDEVTFACNRGFLLAPKLGCHPTYWAIEDTLDAEQYSSEVTRVLSTKFVPEDLMRYNWGEGVVPVPFIRGPFDWPTFSAAPPFEWGGTVVHLMIQIAAFMGCRPIYLLGNDFRWSDYTLSGKALDASGQVAPDVDHFDERYWPKGFRSFPPNPTIMRRAFLAANRAQKGVINLTPNSALDVFERQDYAEVLGVKLPLDRPAMEQHPTEIDSLHALVRVLDSKHILEIGVRAGGTSALWHDLCSGLVIGVDKAPNDEMVKRFPRYRHVVGNSHDDQTLQKVERLLGPENVDLLFIDGDHSLKGTTEDYEMYRSLVRPGGIIAFHDINAAPHHFEEWEEGGSPRFWRELDVAGKSEYSVGSSWGGIGVVPA